MDAFRSRAFHVGIGDGVAAAAECFVHRAEGAVPSEILNELSRQNVLAMEKLKGRLDLQALTMYLGCTAEVLPQELVKYAVGWSVGVLDFRDAVGGKPCGTH